MPPKGKAPSPKKAAPKPSAKKAPSGTGPQWQYMDDSQPSGWSNYPAKQSSTIESASAEGKPTVVVGDYEVNFKAMRQTHKRDASRWRTVRRLGAPAASLTPSAIIETHYVDTTDDESCSVPKKRTRGETGDLVVIHSGDTTPLVRIGSADGRPVVPVTPTPGADIAAAMPPPAPAPSPSTKMPSRSGPYVLLNTEATSADTLAMVASVLGNVPVINKMPLNTAAKKMIDPSRTWLTQLGRMPNEEGVFVTLNNDLTKLNSRRKVAMNSKFTTTVGNLQRLAKASRVSHIGPCPDPLLLPCKNASVQNSMSGEQHLHTQLMMISGPVWVLYDNDYEPIADPPVVCACSIPGINFAYSDADKKAFTERAIDEDTGQRTGPFQINVKSALGRMRQIWGHTLTVMDGAFEVEYAVLCAIGCGAFKGKYASRVPRLWGAALVASISNRKFKHIKTIFVSLPTFGTDNNYAPFKAAVEAALAEVPAENRQVMPLIVLVEDASMVTIAAHISKCGKHAGIMNPSDVQALRHGWIGMYWDGGHIALEEILAMQTSLLLQHVGVNRPLYMDASRRYPVEL